MKQRTHLPGILFFPTLSWWRCVLTVGWVALHGSAGSALRVAFKVAISTGNQLDVYRYNVDARGNRRCTC